MTVELHHGDCLDVLRAMPDASVDAVVTDPPYGLGFMGKKWDTPGALVERKADTSQTWDHVGGNHNPSNATDAARTRRAEGQKFQEWAKAWAAECRRALKPGGHMLAFGGTRMYHRLACGIEDAGLEIRDTLAWLYGSGFPKSHNLGDGWGTALKPAHEPIILARKAPVGTVAANVQAHGTGGLNIDACRIGTDGGTAKGSFPNGASLGKGRWPANVVLDEVAAAALDEAVGELGLSSGTETAGNANPNGIYGKRVKLGKGAIGFGDRGGPSRFFYTSKAGREDRELEDGTRSTHPTVKPVDLMRWLVRLVTPPGSVVLDPFMGSGSTGVACVHERFRFIGIERETEYVAIARARLDAATRQGVLDL